MEQTGREEIFECSGPESGVGDRRAKGFSLFVISGAEEGITAAWHRV